MDFRGVLGFWDFREQYVTERAPLQKTIKKKNINDCCIESHNRS